MSNRIRIFLSHSSGNNALTAGVAAILGRQRQADGITPAYDVLVDKERLETGRPWPKQLHAWLAQCHAGLVLLTEEAVKSAWVLKESTILQWRLDRDPAFRLFIVRFAEATDALLEQYRFAPLELRRIHSIKVTEAGAAGRPASWSDIETRITNELGKQLVGVRTYATPFDQLVDDLGKWLGNASDSALQEVAERVRAEPPAWDAQRDEREQYLEEIARRILSENLGGFAGVHDLIGVLGRSLDKGPLQDVLDIVAPHWVDGVAASRLRVISNAPRPITAALNGEAVQQYTARMYVMRAHFMGIDFVLPEVAGGDAGEGPEYISSQICRWFRDRNILLGSDTAIRKALQTWPATVYVVLPDPIDNAALQQLKSWYEKVTFIFPTGETMQTDPSLEDVECLEPAVDVTVETEQQGSFNAAVAFIANKKR